MKKLSIQISGARFEFHSVRNKLKSAIRTARKAFIEKALYSNKVARGLESHPQSAKAKCEALRFDPDELNDFFATTAQRTLETRATLIEDLTCLIDNLHDVPSEGVRFQLSPVTTFSRSSRIYDRIVLRARIRYLPASSRWLLSAWQSP